MKTITLFRLLVTASLLTAFGVLAQPASINIPSAAEILPASSPYGAATIIRNISYSTNPAPRQNFDLILPAQKGNKPFPLVVWIHGGAWLSGLKEWDNVKYLVRDGYAIASVDYRFSTEAPFPAQIQDCNAALNFILAHATNYGVSSTQFVVGGGSAGGHLALLLGLARNERNFGTEPSIIPLAILDFFGPTDFNKAKNDLEDIHSEKGVELFNDAVPKLLGSSLGQFADKATSASPMTYINKANPPVLIVQGGQDDLVPAIQSRRLQEALDQAGVKNELIFLKDAGHDGAAFSTPEVANKVTSFLNRIFTNSPASR
jgi:acetyl esterase/lipase